MSALLQSLPKRWAAETDDGGKLRNLEGAILSRSSMVGFAHESPPHLGSLTARTMPLTMSTRVTSRGYSP